MLKDMADATGIVAAARLVGEPWCWAPVCSVSRWRPGLARWLAVRVADLAEPPMERHSGGRPPRWRSPACTGSASGPTWGPPSSG